MTLVKELEELMELRDWSRTQLAAALGVSDSAVCYWIAGERNMSRPVQMNMRRELAAARAEAAAAKAG